MAILAPVGENSTKPEEIHGRIERLVEGPYLELFARGRRGAKTSEASGIEPARADRAVQGRTRSTDRRNGVPRSSRACESSPRRSA